MLSYGRVSSSSKVIWIVVLSLASLLMSSLVAFCMIVVTYPGDECLLFVGVRGEALIYGNPIGCYFITIGHVIIGAGALFLLFLLFCRPRKGFMKRQNENGRMAGSNHTLRGSSMQRPGPPSSSQPTVMQFKSWQNTPSEYAFNTGRYQRFYSTKPIMLAMVLSMISLITALVAISGYFITCDELEYEAQRQIQQVLPLGKPFKNIALRCWSLFRNSDFHTRFHFDHYEFKGLWRGQYEGYEHGKTHHFESKHNHIMDTALALELCLSGAWLCTLFWVVTLCLMIYLRVRAKQLQRRELAESVEDARIFASANRIVDGGFPQPQMNGHVGGSSMQMNTLDSKSSLHHHNNMQLQQQPAQYVSAAGSVVSAPAGMQVDAAPLGAVSPMQQQMVTQQAMLEQQMAQMQLLQQQNLIKQASQQNLARQQQQLPNPGLQQQQVQYFQLPDGSVVQGLVPAAAQPPTNSQPLIGNANQSQAQSTISQSNGTHQNNQPSNKDKLNVGSSSASNGRPDKSNDSSAQKQQMKISNDVGMKCSQI